MTPINIRTALIVCAVAFVITAAIGPAVIRYLRKMKFGQKILEIGPKWHMNKQNIPTMGGFMFIIGIAVAVLAGNTLLGGVSVSSLAVLGLAAAYGAVGLVDDYAKIRKKGKRGADAQAEAGASNSGGGRVHPGAVSGVGRTARPLDPVYRCGDPASPAAVHHLCRVRYRGRG